MLLGGHKINGESVAVLAYYRRRNSTLLLHFHFPLGRGIYQAQVLLLGSAAMRVTVYPPTHKHTLTETFIRNCIDEIRPQTAVNRVATLCLLTIMFIGCAVIRR